MPSAHITIPNNNGCYFVTCTVVHWYYLFDRHNRWQILADAITYAIKQKNLKLYGFVFMLNHIHILFSSPDTSGFLRDFKKFTSKRMKENIIATEPTILSIFTEKEEKYQLWQITNMPVIIESEKIFKQKLEYIHYNPVKKQYVEKPEYWYWLSANPNCPIPIEKDW
jgi:REP element-mobilizing transposase RayT